MKFAISLRDSHVVLTQIGTLDLNRTIELPCTSADSARDLAEYLEMYVINAEVIE